MSSAEKEHSREPASTAAAPKRLGKYELIARIGKGGMAQVYLARQRGPANFEKVVVVKTIHPHLAAKKSFIDMLLDEARIAALLKHPCVVDIYDLGTDGDTYFIAMEYLSGEPLLSVLRAGRVQKKPLDVQSTCRIIADVADGLHAAHELTDNAGNHLELVHRDVTPGNVVVLYNGQVKIVDFGIAKARGRLAGETDARKLKGKLGYVAPEQVRGQTADRRADIFALGVVMWEALTYRRLFRGTKPGTVLAAIVKEPLRPPSSVRPDVPAEIDAICMRALARDPGERYSTAQEMYADIEAFLAGTGASLQRKAIATYMNEAFAEQIDERARLLREMHESNPTAADEPKDASAAFASNVGIGEDEEAEDTDDDLAADLAQSAPLPPAQEPGAPLPPPSVVVAADAGAPAPSAAVEAAAAQPGSGGTRRASSSGSTSSPSGELAAQSGAPWPVIAAQAATRRRRRLLLGGTAVGLFLIVLLAVLGGDEPPPRAATAGVGGDAVDATPEPPGQNASAAGKPAGPEERAGAAGEGAAPGEDGGWTGSPDSRGDRGAGGAPADRAAGEAADGGLVIHDEEENRAGGEQEREDDQAALAAAPAQEQDAPRAARGADIDRQPASKGAVPGEGQDDSDTGTREAPARGGTASEGARARRAARKRARALYQQGATLFVKGEFTAAQIRFREAMNLAPGYAPPYRGMGLVHQATGQRKKAAQAYRKYLDLAPRAPDRGDIQARLRSLGE